MSSEVSQSLAAAMSRPQIGIDRLPARRVSNEPREAMNCKSCRKRKVEVLAPFCEPRLTSSFKIKCNRTRPTCEACQVFNCPCIYGMLPYERHPNLDLTSSCRRRAKKERAQDRRA
jgi:hypothetical protein